MPIIKNTNDERRAAVRGWKDARAANHIERTDIGEWPRADRPRPVIEVVNEVVKEIRTGSEELINKEYSVDLSRLNPNETYLVHKGQIKLISKKSKYLLDMLIIEEEN